VQKSRNDNHSALISSLVSDAVNPERLWGATIG
jgi:hypothetical protein